MNSEAQPMRITADTEPARPWFVSWDLCRSPEAVHIGDRYFEVRHAEVHKKTPVRIAAMEAVLGFYESGDGSVRAGRSPLFSSLFHFRVGGDTPGLYLARAILL